MDLFTKRRLNVNKLELNNGFIEYPTVFRNPLKIDKIFLEGNLYPENNQITLSKFSTTINEDYYEGNAIINLEDLETIGNLTQLKRKNIFYNMNLESEGLKFNLDPSGFDIEGEAVLSGIDIFLKGSKNYKNHENFISKYNLKATIDEKNIENLFKIKIRDFISGPIDLDATYFILKDNKEIIETKNNLKNSTISFPL